MKAYRENRSKASHTFLTLALDGGEWSASCSGSFSHAMHQPQSDLWPSRL